jgi:hypothetical protein
MEISHQLQASAAKTSDKSPRNPINEKVKPTAGPGTVEKIKNCPLSGNETPILGYSNS